MSTILPRPVAQKTAVMDRKTERRLMDSYDGTACECCGAADGTVVAAHYRKGNAGTGYRPPGIVAGLCFNCHEIADGRVPGDSAEIWLRVLVKLLTDRAKARADEMTAERDSKGDGNG